MKVDDYESLGFETIPLKAGKKLPLRSGWQRQDSQDLWQNAPADSNIGLRGGGEANAAFLDCDDKTSVETFTKAQRWLDSLGYPMGVYPVIKTASGVGRHVYLSFAGGLSGNYRLLSPEFGAGEFRYGRGSYVVAPESEVNGAIYTKIAGEFYQLPTITLADVLPILANKTTRESQSTSYVDQHIHRIPKRTLALLRGLQAGNFPTRSELEQSVILGLVNAGHTFESILAIFKTYQPAKFAELYSKNPSRAEGWLLRSFENARKRADLDSPTRQKIKNLISLAENSPWQGRTGLTDRAVYLAHLAVAHRTGGLSYGVSVRSLAELAGVGKATASRSTVRLAEVGLLKTETLNSGENATLYVINPEGQTETIPHNYLSGIVPVCPSHDVFRFRGLGKTAFEIYSALNTSPLTISELSERTGRHPKTIKRTLKKMSKIVDSTTGEVLAMVEREGDKWRSLPCDFDLLATVLGVAGTGERQKIKHQQERREYRKKLAELRREQTNDNPHP